MDWQRIATCRGLQVFRDRRGCRARSFHLNAPDIKRRKGKMMRIWKITMAAAALLFVGCFTKPPPPPRSTVDLPKSEEVSFESERSLEELRIIKDVVVPYNRYKNHMQFATDLGSLADIAVLMDLDAFPNLVCIYKDRVFIVENDIGLDSFNKTLDEQGLIGSRGAHILVSESCVEWRQALIGYLTRLSKGFQFVHHVQESQIINVDESLSLHDAMLNIEKMWLASLKSGEPLQKAMRDRVQAHAAFMKKAGSMRAALPPPYLPPPAMIGKSPDLSEAEDAAAKAKRILEQAERIGQKLARKADVSGWTPTQISKHETLRSAVEDWRVAAAKRLAAEVGYREAAASGLGQLFSMKSVWESRYASYAAFAEACAAAIDAEWRAPLPPYVAQNGVRGEDNWRLDSVSAALEEARASLSVWETDWVRFKIPNVGSLPAYQEWRAAAQAWVAAVQEWQAVLANDGSDALAKSSAADAASAARYAWEAADMPQLPKAFTDLLPAVGHDENREMDVDTLIYEIVVYKITECFIEAIDIKNIRPAYQRRSLEARAAAALEQLIAAKEWKSVAMERSADFEEKRLARSITLSFGPELWLLAEESMRVVDDIHPLSSVNFDIRPSLHRYRKFMR